MINEKMPLGVVKVTKVMRYSQNKAFQRDKVELVPYKVT